MTSLVEAFVQCAGCRHRKGLHWLGAERCGYYEGDRSTLRFENGKPVAEKVGQCPCEKYVPAPIPGDPAF